MTGYQDDTERHAESMAGGYYHTGDQHQRGRLHTYVGRTDDVFNASDYKISPFELESVLIEPGRRRGRRSAGARPRPPGWEHSHAIETPEGLRTMCVYGAPDEQYVRDHAKAAGLPCDRVQEIGSTVGPADFS